MYKSKLHELCQKKGWRNPIYSSKKDGHDHTPLFKASVLVNGLTFASRSFFKSTKIAGNDAAEVALAHFTASSGGVSKTGEADGPVLPEEMVTPATPPGQSAVSIEEADSKRSMESYLLCNKVRVYTSIPVTALPKGTVMLPIGEDKWTMVSLES